jgi:hypothetical protein
LKGLLVMSLIKHLEFDQLAATTLEPQLESICRLVADAYEAACDGELNHKTLDVIARTLHEARQEINYLAISIAQCECTAHQER